MTSAKVYGAPILIDGALRAADPSYIFEIPVIAGAQRSLGPVTVEVDWVSGTHVLFTDVVTVPEVANPKFGIGGLMPGAMGIPQGAPYSPGHYYVARRSASTLPVGVIGLTVRIKAGGFTFTYPETMRVFCHRDGTRMPCPERRWVSDDGSDMNDGRTPDAPKRTIDAAIDSCLVGSATRDLSGAEIVVLKGDVRWNNGNWRTSEPGWLTITGAMQDTRLKRANPLAYNASTDSLRMGSSSLPGQARVCLTNMLFDSGSTPNLYLANGVAAHLRLDQCKGKSSYYQPVTAHPTAMNSVRWADDFSPGAFFAVDGFTASPVSRYFTACHIYGSVNGFEQYKLALDCKASALGITYYHNGNVPTAITATCTVEGIALSPGKTAGYVRLPPLDADPGITLTASTPSPGILRIQAPTGSSVLNDLIELGPTVPGLHTNPAYGIRVEGFTVTAAINGTRKVIGHGNSGGRDYADFDSPISLGAPETTTNGRMYTANLRGGALGLPVWNLHPDCLYLAGTRSRDIVADLAFYNCFDTQVMFTNQQGALERRDSCWFRNIRGPGNPLLVNNLKGGPHIDCLWEHVSDAGQIQFSPGFQHTGSVVMNSVFGTVGDSGTIGASGLAWSHVHIIGGPAIGTSGTTGDAWSALPNEGPFHMDPLPALVGTGLGGASEPTVWAFSPTAPSRGAWKNTSRLNWENPPLVDAESFPTAPTSLPSFPGATDNPLARIRGLNGSTRRFRGWMPYNTDTLPLGPDAAGRSHGYFVHHGKTSGWNTRKVDILVQLEPGTGIGLPDLVLSDSQSLPIPTVDPSFFGGGEPRFANVPFPAPTATQDGRATVRHWRMRHPTDERFLIQMWGVHYPGEPWMRAEILVAHNHIERPELARQWPGGTLTYGNGVLTIMGAPNANGTLVEFDTTFNDGQLRPMPALWHWPNRYRNTDDSSSVEALRTFLVDGHGITRVYFDGNAYEKLGFENWGITNRDATFARIHTWEESFESATTGANPTGQQAEQAFNRSEPYYHINALPKAYAEAMQAGRKPSYFYEVNGDPLDIEAKSGATFSSTSVRLFAGRPYFAGGVVPPLLGKFGDLNLSGGSGVGGLNRWDGYGEQHDWASTLHEVTRYKGTPMLVHMLELHGVRWLGRWFDHPSFGPTHNLKAVRSALMGMKTAAECYWGLKNRTLAERIATRSRNRSVLSNGAFAEIFAAPSTDGIWDVITDVPTTSIPLLPGYSGFINPAATYYFDLCMRVIGGMEELRPKVNAARDTMLDRVWKLLVPAFVVPPATSPPGGWVPSTDWQAFEQQNLDGTFFSVGTNYNFSWPILNIDHARKAGIPKAIAIWDQMMARAPLGTAQSESPQRKWFPPQPENVATEEITGGIPGTEPSSGGGSGGTSGTGTGTAGTSQTGNGPPPFRPGGGTRGGRGRGIREWKRRMGID